MSQILNSGNRPFRSKLIIFAACFPLLGLLAWWAQLTFFAFSGTMVELRVTGFDPRDLLAGHYLEYRVDFGEVAACDTNSSPSQQERCVCLQPTDGESYRAKASWSGACEARPNCPVFLKGSCSYGRFSAGIERYYIPEAFSSQLRVAPDNSSIRVVVNSSGKGMVVDYRVNDVPLLEFAKMQPIVELSQPEVPEVITSPTEEASPDVDPLLATPEEDPPSSSSDQE